MLRKWRDTEGEEDRECDRRTSLRELWKDWEQIGEQQQQLNGIGVDRERSERNVGRGKKRRRNDDINHGQPHP